MSTPAKETERDRIPSEYIRANFEPSDRIAILLRNRTRGETVQRISTADRVAGPSFQEWMRYKNDKGGCDVYIGMNTLKPGAFTRTKDDILAIRHLYLDLDQDGSTSLAALEKSSLVPPASFVLNTSPDKYQVIWKVEGIALQQAEGLQHAMARQFDADHAATDSARVLRVPGFMNKKYQQDFPVTVQFSTGRTYHLRDFKIRTEPIDSDYRLPRGSTRTAPTSEKRPVSQSERDWAYVKASLASGADPEGLISQLAHSRAADKPDPQYYARLTVTKALGQLGMSPEPSSSSAVAGGDDRDTQH